MREKSGIIILKEVNEEEHNKVVKEAEKSLKESSLSFKSILNSFSKLEPQGRIYFINEIIVKILSNSKLPPFIITGMLEGIKHLFQINIIKVKRLDSKIYEKAGYVG